MQSNNKENTLIKNNKKKSPKFKVGDHVRLSKYKTIFTKDCVPNWSKEPFVIRNVKSTLLRTHGCFMKENYKKQIKKTLELKSSKGKMG